MTHLHILGVHDSSSPSEHRVCDIRREWVPWTLLRRWCTIQTQIQDKKGMIDYRDFCDDFASKDSKHEKRSGNDKKSSARSKYSDSSDEGVYWYMLSVNTLQHNATLCNTLQHTATHDDVKGSSLSKIDAYCNTLQRTAAHCNTLQHTAIQCSTLQRTATYCNTLQHTTAHCNTLQHAATHCNTL